MIQGRENLISHSPKNAINQGQSLSDEQTVMMLLF
jgi:hypothetical protein